VGTTGSYDPCADVVFTPPYLYTLDAAAGVKSIVMAGAGAGAGGGPPPPAPVAPSALMATVVSSSQINLDWTDNANNEDGFRIERSIDNITFTEIAIVGPSVTSYANTALAPATTYYYRVRAYNAGGASAYSNTAGATTQAAAPAAPTGLTATAGNAQVTLSWNASAGATSYNVKRATVSGGPYTTIATGVTGASYIDAGLVNGTTYYYVVSAVNAVGESGNSSQVSATPASGTTPAPPTGLSAQTDNHNIRLNWKKSTSPNITQNKVYRSTVNGGPYTLIATIPAATSYTDTGLTIRTTYYYVVTAVNSSGQESAYSNQVNKTSQ